MPKRTAGRILIRRVGKRNYLTVRLTDAVVQDLDKALQTIKDDPRFACLDNLTDTTAFNAVLDVGIKKTLEESSE